MQCVRLAFKNYVRKFSSKPNYVLEHLTNRGLLRLRGKDTGSLLQGLVTNDIANLHNGPGSMYAMFLNNKGRVLYDTIIYRPSNDNLYYVEVDIQVVDLLQKHLNAYRLRRKVDISLVGDELKIWTYFNAACTELEEEQGIFALHDNTVPWVKKKTEIKVTRKAYEGGEFLIFPDPRLPLLGSRILAPCDSDLHIVELFPGVGEPTYKNFRYRIGVGEGIDELPPGNCFPLESNGDYLHGISFHKGCYIGQELTARSHYTGVIRKRLMPLILTKPFATKPEKAEPVRANGEDIGKLRGYDTNTALGLLRIEKAVNADKILVRDTEVQTAKPTWWPQEVSKERVASRK